MNKPYNYILLVGILLVLSLFAQSAGKQNWKFREGVHYTKLVPVQGTSSSPNKIEVAEIFWYGCLHCYRIDAYVDEWRKKQPSRVQFIHIPALWDPKTETHARLFFALKALGELERAHKEVFRAIHTENKQLLSLADQVRFGTRLGVEANDYRNAYRAFAVENQLRRVKDLMRRYRILAVPTFVVNGKYVVVGTPNTSFRELLEIVDELVQRELTEREPTLKERP